MDAEIISFTSACIRRLFSGDCLENETISRMERMLKQKEARKVFGRTLNQQRTISKRLEPKPFEQLAILMRIAIEACSESNDFTVAKTLVNMAATYHTGENRTREFIQSRLKGLPLLQDSRLWEELFFDACAVEKRASSARNVVWKQLSPTEREDATVRFRNAIFGQLGTFVFNMMEIGVSELQVRTFAKKMCAASELPEEDATQLMASIDAFSLPTARFISDALNLLLQNQPLPNGMCCPTNNNIGYR